MKFNKFLKEVGTHGAVVEINESEKWLVCGGVGMIIPKGVDNLLGSKNNEDYTHLVKSLRNEELNDKLELDRAVLQDPQGNAKSIYRVFESEFGESVGIINSDYGLLEKSDALGYTEVIVSGKDNEPDSIVKYMLVFNEYDKKLQGFIQGSRDF